MSDKDDDKKPVVIKKYANRRLYHTGLSGYITLDDIAQMVRRGEDFVVQDSKTGEDLTRNVLTQIIFDQENKTGETLLPDSFLRQLIGLYNDNMGAVLPSFLDMSLNNFVAEQDKIREMMSQSFGALGFEQMEAQTKKNMQHFQEAMQAFNPFSAFMKPHSASTSTASAKENTPKEGVAKTPDTDIQSLREELAKMQAKIETLDKK